MIPAAGAVTDDLPLWALLVIVPSLVAGLVLADAQPWLARRAPGLPSQVIVAVAGDEVHVLEQGFVRGAKRIESWPAGTFTASWRRGPLRLKLSVRLDDGRPRELSSLALQVGRTAKARRVVERVAALAHP